MRMPIVFDCIQQWVWAINHSHSKNESYSQFILLVFVYLTTNKVSPFFMFIAISAVIVYWYLWTFFIIFLVIKNIL